MKTSILVLLLLTTLALAITADPSVNIAWFEPAQFQDLPSFNIRFDPLHDPVDSDALTRIFFPRGTELTVDYTDVRCTVWTNGDKRYHHSALQVHPSSKRGGLTHIDMQISSEWFNPKFHNMLIRCFGLTMPDVLLENALVNEPDAPSHNAYLGDITKSYILKSAQAALTPEGKRL